MERAPEVLSHVGGERVEATSGRSFPTTNPATGEVLGRVHEAGEADVDRAVETARRAFPAWARTPPQERGRILRRAAELLRERNRELAELEVRDTGKPIQEAEAVDVESGAECLDFFAGLTGALRGEHADLGSAFVYTRREPLGVCAGIGAWNYPLQIACWKSAPALACGNTMVFKPAELTPLTAMELADVYVEAGLPPGVFNVVHGATETGRLLTRHPGVDKVSLTGEVETGSAAMADAAGTLKHVSFELGGKSPLLVFADADVEQAVAGAMLGNFYTQGEVCSNGTRVYLHREIADAFLERLVAKTAALRIGNPLDADTQVGALISPEHLDKVLGYIEIGKQEGARVVVGGGRATVPALPDGLFVEPTVLVDCEDSMRVVREEIFGPVMSVLTFEDEDDVVARANDTRYGLAAGLFTRDLARAHRVAARLQAGICWINNYNVTPMEMPYGGTKRSGLGRENGLAALESYTQLKSVYVELGEVDSPY